MREQITGQRDKISERGDECDSESEEGRGLQGGRKVTAWHPSLSLSSSFLPSRVEFSNLSFHHYTLPVWQFPWCYLLCAHLSFILNIRLHPNHVFNVTQSHIALANT